MTGPERRSSGPRHTWATIALLAVLSLGNAYSLAVLVVAWVDEVDHGADFGDEVLMYVAAAAILQALALGALVAAWFTRLWGAQTYLAVQAFALVVLLVAAPGAFGVLALMPVVLAGVLLAVCGKAWKPPTVLYRP